MRASVRRFHAVALACGCLDLGVDQLLYGAAAQEVAGLAFSGQDVGATSDAELRVPGLDNQMPCLRQT
jgi:hypothetical protein